jgi:drug/metabolite transporter (DMT)-like permease
VLYLGVIPTALGFTTWTYALACSTAGQMAAATYTIPAIVILLSWLLLNQVPAPLAWLGGAVCLAGTLITQLRQPGRSPAGGGPAALSPARRSWPRPSRTPPPASRPPR